MSSDFNIPKLRTYTQYDGTAPYNPDAGQRITGNINTSNNAGNYKIFKDPIMTCRIPIEEPLDMLKFKGAHSVNINVLANTDVTIINGSSTINGEHVKKLYLNCYSLACEIEIGPGSYYVSTADSDLVNIVDIFNHNIGSKADPEIIIRKTQGIRNDIKECGINALNIHMWSIINTVFNPDTGADVTWHNKSQMMAYMAIANVFTVVNINGEVHIS